MTSVDPSDIPKAARLTDEQILSILKQQGIHEAGRVAGREIAYASEDHLWAYMIDHNWLLDEDALTQASAEVAELKKQLDAAKFDVESWEERCMRAENELAVSNHREERDAAREEVRVLVEAGEGILK